MDGVQYIYASPRWHLEGTEAVQKEIISLHKYFGGVIKNVYPNHFIANHRPIITYGYEFLRSLLKSEETVTVNHFFGPALMNYSFLSRLKKPVVYTITAPALHTDRLPPKPFMGRISTIVASDEESSKILSHRLDREVKFVLPGIDFEGSNRDHSLNTQPFVLTMASAPWRKEQIETKGLILIFEALRQLSDIRFQLLLRGRFQSEILDLVRTYGLEEKVELINEAVNINQILDNTHATILVVSDPKVVKSFPHSLIESMMCGCPIIVSSNIPISRKFKESQLVNILSEWNPENLVRLLHKLQVDLSSGIRPDITDFNQYTAQAMCQRYKEIYRKKRMH